MSSSDDDTLIHLTCTNSDAAISENESDGSHNNSDKAIIIVPYNFEPYLSNDDNRNAKTEDLDRNDSVGVMVRDYKTMNGKQTFFKS